ncbi:MULTISPECIES: hypothetical protein [Aerococcus]|uniref:Uncharacterized protein n=2 Tax=Aerococcus viridans TaxID=1377 RepID=A0AAU8U5R1_9LACT|nr:hypothetical protein [Aerococcus viridans]AMC01485.1 hypothetical protein AWM76_07925 [Aerococcus viridans]EFG49309.1 hypothetical protein HMPREF0061_1290 [Aerococcus viridans ATCC 11563 = CCUG 4311]MEC1387126.1 hypothetical protein [Aerococcus viridans]SPT62404.1 Uncharacterised protein [Aerococcus viridans]SUU15005.1 Uncharacterised protein [Aerococcus viridans]
MRTDELYSKLINLGFIENYYVASKEYKDGSKHRILKIYDDDSKLAEVALDQPYMIRTTYEGFEARNELEKQALLNLLINYAQTPIEGRQSALYFAYYHDLNNIVHFIKRLRNKRLTDDMIPLAYFTTLTPEQRESFLFSMSEFDDFPEAYRPRFTPDSFVKVISYEEFSQNIHDRYNLDMPEAEPSYSRADEEEDDVKEDGDNNQDSDTTLGDVHDILDFRNKSDDDQPDQ